MSGVLFDVSNYLSTHPDVNNYFTSLKGQPRDQIRDQVQTYRALLHEPGSGETWATRLGL